MTKDLETLAIEERRLYQKQWREKNKERVNLYHKKWRAKNKDKIASYHQNHWLKKAQERLKENAK